MKYRIMTVALGAVVGMGAVLPMASAAACARITDCVSILCDPTKAGCECFYVDAGGRPVAELC